MTKYSSRSVRSGAVVFGVAGALVAALLVAPAAQAVEPQSSSDSAARPGLTQQDLQLVDGALFGIGPVAAQLGTSIDLVLSGEDLARVRAYARESREGLVASHGAEVERAVEDIRSGSVNEVESGFRALGAAFMTYVEETSSPQELQRALEEQSSTPVVPRCGAVAACIAAVAFVAYAGVAVHNAAALTAAAAVLVSVYLWCGAWVGCGRSADSTGVDRVQREKFLANATRVARALPA